MCIDMRIRPYSQNESYWQYKGQPVMLIGGSVEDNLFQISDIEEHLDVLKSVGGNYVRCTMSSRDEGNVWPHERENSTGLYNLEEPGVEYWHRFEKFLDLTCKRDIVLQIEVWDRFDFSKEPWQDNPYNPKNNCNYSADEVGLRAVIDTHPGQRENAFFRSVPALENNVKLLKYQTAQVDQMLKRSLAYPNVLYCMDNETNESPEWGLYWAEYIRAKARAESLHVETTEMWDEHDLNHPQHAFTYDYTDTYTFLDISQNNHQCGRTHWENAQAVRNKILSSGRPRPLNCVKVYGANSGRYGTNRDAIERFWRCIVGGMATVRFHRPPTGIGLDEIAQSHLRSARMLLDELPIWECSPNLGLLDWVSWNEAYATSLGATRFAVFFCDGGEVQLIVPDAEVKRRTYSIKWLDVAACGWLTPERAVIEDNRLKLKTPRIDGYWVALVDEVTV